nr:MAG TPA: hypothetical protein [Caudoviricetes sp.]
MFYLHYTSLQNAILYKEYASSKKSYRNNNSLSKHSKTAPYRHCLYGVFLCLNSEHNYII